MGNAISWLAANWTAVLNGIAITVASASGLVALAGKINPNWHWDDKAVGFMAKAVRVLGTLALNQKPPAQ